MKRLVKGMDPKRAPRMTRPLLNGSARIKCAILFVARSDKSCDLVKLGHATGVRTGCLWY